MLELRLHSGAVVAFDGRVLEVFEAEGASKRFHVTGLSPPRLVEEPEGNGRIVVGEPPLTLQLACGEAPACKRLLAAIEQALAAESRAPADG